MLKATFNLWLYDEDGV